MLLVLVVEKVESVLSLFESVYVLVQLVVAEINEVSGSELEVLVVVLIS